MSSISQEVILNSDVTTILKTQSNFPRVVKRIEGNNLYLQSKGTVLFSLKFLLSKFVTVLLQVVLYTQTNKDFKWIKNTGGLAVDAKAF